MQIEVGFESLEEGRRQATPASCARGPPQISCQRFNNSFLFSSCHRISSVIASVFCTCRSKLRLQNPVLTLTIDVMMSTYGAGRPATAIWYHGARAPHRAAAMLAILMRACAGAP